MPLRVNRSPGDGAVVKERYDALHRYAGWLDRERPSRIVRGDVESLGAAIEANSDPSPHLESLEANIARLPGGELRTMLRKAAAQLRQALEETAR
jgi:hypothetical protein